MRSKFALAGVVATLFAFGADFGATSSLAAGKAGKSKSSSSAEVPDNISRQFKWEEKVVGPNDKKIDHEKIAAMQAAARKEEANKKNEPTVKKAARPQGVGAPSTSTIPTQDIEKPAPVAAKPNRPRAVADREARPRDSLDNLLDSEKDTSPSKAGRDDGLGSVLAVSDGDKPAASSSGRAAVTKGKSKKPHRARQ
jgi:hypothetical protein